MPDSTVRDGLRPELRTRSGSECPPIGATRNRPTRLDSPEPQTAESGAIGDELPARYPRRILSARSQIFWERVMSRQTPKSRGPPPTKPPPPLQPPPHPTSPGASHLPCPA